MSISFWLLLAHLIVDVLVIAVLCLASAAARYGDTIGSADYLESDDA